MKWPTQWVQSHPVWTIIIASLALRLPFLDGSVDFFDSPQYLWRSVLPLISALSSGHAPYHPGYVFWTWLFHHLAGLHTGTPLAAQLISALASTASLVFVFLIARRLEPLLPHSGSVPQAQHHSRSVSVAWLTTALVAVSPFFWISSITILVDPVMIAFYLLSVWLYLIALDQTTRRSDNQKSVRKPDDQTTKIQSNWLFGDLVSGQLTGYWQSGFWFLLSGLAFGWAMFTHTQVIFWGLAFPGLIIALRPAKTWLRTVWDSLLWTIGPALALGAYVALLLQAGHDQTVTGALHYLLLGNAGDRSPFELVSGARNLRLVGGSVLALCALLGSIRLLVKKPSLGIGLGLWLWPGLIVSGLYIYSNLAGRASMIGVVPAALLAASLVLPFRRASLRLRSGQASTSQESGHRPNTSEVFPALGVALLIGSTLATSLPLVSAYATGTPMTEALNDARRGLDPSGLFISSNEAKTLHDYPHFDVVFEQSQDQITADIDATLAAGHPVYIGSDALTYPHYAVDGMNWRIFSLRGIEHERDHGSLSAYLYNRYQLDLVTQLSNQPLGIFQIHKPAPVNTIERLTHSLDALKPGQQAVFGRLVDSARNEPLSHIQINAYGDPAVAPQRLDAWDWPSRLGLWFERTRGARTADPLFWGYTDATGVVFFPLPALSSSNGPAQSEVQQYALVPHTLASGGTLKAPPLFIDPTVDHVARGHAVVTGTAAQVATALSRKTVLATVTALKNGQYQAELTTFDYTLRASQTIKAGELSGMVSTILPDGSRQAEAGQKGNVTYGPWKDLPPGDYVATWKLRRTTEGEDRVLRLDVGYDFGKGTIYEQVVGAGDLPLGQLREISVPFTVKPDMHLLEFRTLALAGPGFIVDSITIKPR